MFEQITNRRDVIGREIDLRGDFGIRVCILPARSSPKHLLSRAGDATDRVEPREAGTPEAQLNYPSRPRAPGLAPSGRSIGGGKAAENRRTPARHWASARGRLAGVDKRSCASRSEQRPS